MPLFERSTGVTIIGGTFVDISGLGHEGHDGHGDAHPLAEFRWLLLITIVLIRSLCA